ncbi:hypothetical protein CR513_42780, partial [Mucuna pruriens]
MKKISINRGVRVSFPRLKGNVGIISSPIQTEGSKVLQGAEARYQKLEKAALALVITTTKLRPCFQSYRIVFQTILPIKQVLRKLDMVRRMVGWTVKLFEFDITFERKGHVKSQILAYFIAELTLTGESIGEAMQPSKGWKLSIVGPSNQKGNGVGVLLEGPNGVLIEQSLRFKLKVSNNQAEYEVLLVGMSHANGDYQARDPQLMKYWGMAKKLVTSFESFTLLHVPRDQNEHTNMLSKLANAQKGRLNRMVIQEMIS